MEFPDELFENLEHRHRRRLSRELLQSMAGDEEVPEDVVELVAGYAPRITPYMWQTAERRLVFKLPPNTNHWGCGCFEDGGRLRLLVWYQFNAGAAHIAVRDFLTGEQIVDVETPERIEHVVRAPDNTMCLHWCRTGRLMRRRLPGLEPLPDLAPLVESIAVRDKVCAFITGEEIVVANWRSGEIIRQKPFATPEGVGYLQMTTNHLSVTISQKTIFARSTLDIVGVEHISASEFIDAVGIHENIKVATARLSNGQLAWSSWWRKGGGHGPFHYDRVDRMFVLHPDVYVVLDDSGQTYIGSQQEEIAICFQAAVKGPDDTILVTESGWMKQLSVKDARPLQKRPRSFAKEELAKVTSSGVPVEVILI